MNSELCNNRQEVAPVRVPVNRHVNRQKVVPVIRHVKCPLSMPVRFLCPLGVPVRVPKLLPELLPELLPRLSHWSPLPHCLLRSLPPSLPHFPSSLLPAIVPFLPAYFPFLRSSLSRHLFPSFPASLLLSIAPSRPHFLIPSVPTAPIHPSPSLRDSRIRHKSQYYHYCFYNEHFII